MSKLVFGCGCEFPIANCEQDIYADHHTGPLPLGIDVDIYNISHTCPRTWALFSEGHTKGVFQLEGNLGRTWARKIQPENLEELSALIALIRPGCLKALSGNPPKSMTQRFKDRKHKLEDIEYMHPALEPVLDTTYGVLVYQEQSMKLTVTLAGFDLQQADVLRKSIGKKKADIMIKVRDEFIGGCTTTEIVTKEQAEEIFGWIQESQKYSFNKCLSPTTVVETIDGKYYTLEDVDIGTQITSPNGPTTIINKYDNGIQDVFEITLESGKTIQCTMSHEFLCKDGLKHTLSEILEHELKIVCQDQALSQAAQRRIIHGHTGCSHSTEKVISVRKIGKMRTVDIEVDNPSHVFYANGGVATSNSHAVSYAEGGYWTAYLKAHFPAQFYCSFLHGAQWKQDTSEEVYELVNDAKLNDIVVRVPDFRDQQTVPYLNGTEVCFGIGDIKNIGKAALQKLYVAINDIDKPVREWSWMDYIALFSSRVSSTVNEALVCCGALDYYGKPRTTMMYEINLWKELTNKEKEWIVEHMPYADMITALRECAHTKKEGGGCHSVKRVQAVENIIAMIEKPPHSLYDTADFIAWCEDKYLGASLTCSRVDGCIKAVEANVTCKDVVKGYTGYTVIAVEVTRIKQVKTKKGKTPGQNMAFMSVADSSCSLDDVVVFPDKWREYKDILYEGNTVLMQGEPSHKKGGGFTAKKFWQI
jgi:DNA polymerase III alpha subunit